MLAKIIPLIRIPLNAGQYNTRIEIMGHGGVIDSINQPVTIKKGRLTFVSDHWAAPRPKNLKQAQAAK